MPIKMDLSKFKHIKSDDKSTTLQHPEGHIITLAHRALSPDSQKQLQALSRVSQMSSTPMQNSEADAQAPDRMYEGGIEDASVYNKPKSAPSTPPPGTPTQTMPNQDSEGDAKKAEAVRQSYESKYPTSDATPEAKGGKVEGRKMYADPQGPVSSSDNAPIILDLDQAAQQPAPVYPPVNSTQAPAPSDDLKASDLSSPLSLLKDKYDEVKPQVEQSLNNNLFPYGKQDLAVANPPPSSAASQPPPQYSPPQQLPSDIPQQQVTGMGNPPPLSGPKGFDPMKMEQNQMANYASGQKGLAQAVGAEGEQQAAQEQSRADQIKQLQGQYQTNYQNLNNETEQHISDMQNGMVDPNKYWTGDANGNGSHSKVLTGLGMILAGFNPTSNPNAAINFLKFNIDKNIEAQSKNLDSKYNIVRANLEQFHNMNDAQAMSNVMLGDASAHMLNSIADKNKSPIAQQQAKIATAQWQAERVPILQQISWNQTLRNMMGNAMSGAQQPSGTSQNPDAAYQSEHNKWQTMQMAGVPGAAERLKYMEDRYVPGVGQSKDVMPEADKSQLTSYKNMNDLMNRSLQFSQQHAGKPLDALSPTDRAMADTIHGQLIGQIKQAQHDGVYKESEANFLTGQIGDSPNSMLANFNSVPRIKTLQSIKQQEYNQLLSKHGFPAQKLPQAAPAAQQQHNGTNQSSQAALAWAQANPNDPRAARIRQQLGQ